MTDLARRSRLPTPRTWKQGTADPAPWAYSSHRTASADAARRRCLWTKASEGEKDNSRGTSMVETRGTSMVESYSKQSPQAVLGGLQNWPALRQVHVHEPHGSVDPVVLGARLLQVPVPIHAHAPLHAGEVDPPEPADAWWRPPDLTYGDCRLHRPALAAHVRSIHRTIHVHLWLANVERMDLVPRGFEIFFLRAPTSWLLSHLRVRTCLAHTSKRPKVRALLYTQASIRSRPRGLHCKPACKHKSAKDRMRFVHVRSLGRFQRPVTSRFRGTRPERRFQRPGNASNDH